MCAPRSKATFLTPAATAFLANSSPTFLADSTFFAETAFAGRISLDSEDAAATMKLILQRWGHRVEVARDGREALETAKRFEPEIVLCDIGLPGELDGYDVARAGVMGFSLLDPAP